MWEEAPAPLEEIEALTTPPALQAQEWLDKAESLIPPIYASGRIYRKTLEAVGERLLALPAVIERPEWPGLVRRLMDRTMSWGDITKLTYGYRAPMSHMEDDEGSAMDAYADFKLYTMDIVFKVLNIPEAVRHPEWASLVEYVCSTKKKRIRTEEFGVEEAKELLSHPLVQNHPACAAVKRALKSAYFHSDL
jgi:hypothetical protein